MNPSHKRVVQSVDFNMMGGMPRGGKMRELQFDQ